jgi:hypothetical protein
VGLYFQSLTIYGGVQMGVARNDPFVVHSHEMRHQRMNLRTVVTLQRKIVHE